MVTTIEYLRRIYAENKWNGIIYGTGDIRYIYESDNYKGKKNKTFVRKDVAYAYELENAK
jgi:hypothetical protein